MRTLPEAFAPYSWAPSTEELARSVELDPAQIVRFDGNVPPWPRPSARPGTIAGRLAEINAYPHGGYPELERAIADYAGVEPQQVVLGAGADDLILLCARAFAGPGDTVGIADSPTYPLYRVAAGLAGADVGDADPAVTFTCRPNNPTGELGDLPAARPLVVDEAYWEYAGETATHLLKDGVVVIRTFSKAFGLAGARIGYALADRETAAELNRRQAPLPVTTLSAQLALAGLADPPDVAPVVEERLRVEHGVRALGLEPLPSRTNFLFVPVDDAPALAEALLRSGVVVRTFPGGIRFNVRDPEDDDLLLDALARALIHAGTGRPAGRPPGAPPARDGRDAHQRAARARRCRPRARGHRRGPRRSPARAARLPRRPRPRARGRRRPRDRRPPHGRGRGDRARRGARPSRSATAAASPGTATRSCRWTTRSRAPRSTSAGGRGPRCSLEHDPGMAAHMLGSLAQAGRLAIHVEATGADDHHVAEAAFKAVGRALRKAVAAEAGRGLPSTKGLV